MLIYEDADPGFFVGVEKTQSERFILIHSHDHETSEVWLIPAGAPQSAPVLIAALGRDGDAPGCGGIRCTSLSGCWSDPFAARAYAIRDRLLQDGSITLAEIATTENVVASYATRLLRLTFLAPDITAAILDGRQPPSLTATKLMGDTRLPLDWRDQRRVLGFA